MTEAATEEETPDLDQDQGPVAGAVMIAETKDTPALAPEIDAVIAAAILVTEAAAVMIEEEADLLRKEAPREAHLMMIEETILSPQVTTSEIDL